MKNKRYAVLALALTFALLLPLASCKREVVEIEQVERIGINTYEDCIQHSGGDFYWYSDERSTQVGHVDGATGGLDFEAGLALGGTTGDTIALGTDDTTADDIDIGSAKDDVLISGEDITLDTADDADALVADDFTFTMESASGLWTVTGTSGFQVDIATDNSAADDVNIGSALDDVDIAGATIDLTGGDDILNIGGADDTLKFTRNDSGSVTYTCADDDANAECVFAGGGTGKTSIGTATSTSAQIYTDGTGDAELVVPNDSIGTAEITDDTITFDNISDSSAVDADTKFTMADGIELELEASHTTGDTEVLLFDVNQVDDAVATDDLIVLKIEATSESGDANDTIKGIVIDWEQGVANTIMDAAIEIDNDETTASTMTDAVIVKSTGVAAGVTDAFDASDSNIVNALNIGDNVILGGDDSVSIGATDDTLILTSNDATATFMGADAAGAADTIYDTTGAGAIIIGSADVTSVNVRGVAVDADMTGGISIDADLASNFSTAAGDITVEAETGSVVIKGDEAVADAITLDADEAAGVGVTINVGSSGGLNVSGGVTNIGGGSPVDAAGDNDLYITADLEVDGAGYFDGAVDMDSTLDVAGAVALASDVTLATDATGGNALAKNEFIGLPRIKNVGIGTMANGTTNTVITDIGDSETPATDWTAIDGDVVMSNDGTYYRQGSASLKASITVTATAGDGCTNPLANGDQDWSDDEAVGMWIRTDTAFDADDLVLQITDNGTDETITFPAVATTDVWSWIELNISGVANGDKDVITDLSIELNTGSDLIGVASNIYFDFIVKWDVGEEETLGVEIPYDGVLSLTVIDATSSAASCANITEYTDYFVHYQTGNDAIVIITDQSDADKVGLALVAYN